MRVLVGGFIVAASPSWAQETDAAVSTIRRFYSALEAAMRSGLDVEARYQQLKPIMMQTFNFQAMIKGALGSRWTSISQSDRNRLEEAYSNFMVATYANKLDSYAGEKFNVESPSIAGGRNRTVHTKIVDSRGVSRVINFSVGSDMKVSDTYFDGTISDKASRHSEFTGIVDRSGAEELIRSLEARVAKLLRR